MRIYLVFLVGLLTSCSKENKNYNSRFTIINAVPNSSAFTLRLGGHTIDSTSKYGFPEYELVAPAATTTMQWKHNASTGFDSTLFTDVPNGSDYTLLFFDSLSRYQSYLVLDQWKQAYSKTQGYYRFFPMVIGGTELRITNDTLKVLIGPRNFADFTSSSSSFTVIDTFTTKLRLYNGSKLLDSIPGASIQPGKSYSIYAIGVINNTTDKRPRIIMHEHE